MSKFYVESGSMMEIVDAVDPEKGVRKAIHRYLNNSAEEISFGNLIFIGEQGFAEENNLHPKDLFIETEFVLKEMGLFSNFEVEKPKKPKNRKSENC